MADKQMGTLIAQWTVDGTQTRLVALGKYTKGYEDEYVIEKIELDALGTERWMHQHSISTDNELATVLIKGIKALAIGKPV